MSKVCEDWFPEGSFKSQRGAGFYLHPTLKLQLDALIKNIIYDWDFTIIVSGSGQVRVGKSTLAAQIGSYLSYMMGKIHNKKVLWTLNNNFVFDGTKLIEQGTMLGERYPYSTLVYDEAGADLIGRKVMKAATQQVMDYFRECGQYNLFNILVIPEFFDLPQSIAVNRSKCLIDVTYSADDEGIFQRGEFKFYSFPNKSKLYLFGKKTLNYRAYPCDFTGDFTQFFPLGKEEYKRIKSDVMKSRGNVSQTKFQTQRDSLFYILYKEAGWSQKKISERLSEVSTFSITPDAISYAIKDYPLRNGVKQTPEGKLYYIQDLKEVDDDIVPPS